MNELPTRKQLDHRGPLSLDISGAWYFVTIVGGRGDCPQSPAIRSFRPDDPTPPERSIGTIAPTILDVARYYHLHGKWRLALCLVMPDHIHLIVHFPTGECGQSKRETCFEGPERSEPEGCASRRGTIAPTMSTVIKSFKSYLVKNAGLSFQRYYWDTRLRDDAHYAEKFRYICNNPVRKNLVPRAVDWPYVIAFDRETGLERPHR